MIGRAHFGPYHTDDFYQRMLDLGAQPMGHWRDGGIGNMAGSDDRPIEKWTLLERLNNLLAFTMAGGDAQELAHTAAEEVERLREEKERWPKASR